MRGLLTVIAIALIATSALGTDTTRGKLQNIEDPNRVIEEIDSLAPGAPNSALDSLRNPRALTLSTFRKRASDIKESFNVTNNTAFHVTGAKLLLRYSGIGGDSIAQQTVVIQCDIMPGQQQRVSINSFDTQRRYHYRYGSTPRLRSTPFDVKVKILSYYIAIDNYPD